MAIREDVIIIIITSSLITDGYAYIFCVHADQHLHCVRSQQRHFFHEAATCSRFYHSLNRDDRIDPFSDNV